MSANSISYKKPLLETPFHEKTREKCYAHDWYRWAGYKAVNQYTSAELEYTSMRNTAGVIDISPMHKYSVKGKDAKKFINKLITRDITNIQPHQVVYGIWCNEDGFVIDDGTVFCFDENNFRICSGERNLNWFEDTAIGYDVKIEDVSHSIAALAFQGPLSCKILHMLNANNIEKLKPFYFDQFTINDQKITISRTGFSGDLGYELWCDPSQAHDVWDALFSFNKDYKILAAGLNALDMVRGEAGFIVVNADLIAAEHALRPNRMRTPFELGLAWMVNLDKEYFNGKKALIKQKNRGVEKKLVGLDIQGDKPAVGSVLYSKSKKEIGIVTAAMWSPSLKSNIAIGYVDKEKYETRNKNSCRNLSPGRARIQKNLGKLQSCKKTILY